MTSFLHVWMNSLSVSVIPFINTFKTCLLNVVIKGWQIQICIDFIWINLMLNSSSKIVKYYSQLCFDHLLKLYKQKLSFPVDRKLFTSCQYQYPLAGQLPLPLWPMVSKLSTSYRSIIQKKSILTSTIQSEYVCIHFLISTSSCLVII